MNSNLDLFPRSQKPARPRPRSDERRASLSPLPLPLPYSRGKGPIQNKVAPTAAAAAAAAWVTHYSGRIRGGKEEGSRTREDMEAEEEESFGGNTYTPHRPSVARVASINGHCTTEWSSDGLGGGGGGLEASLFPLPPSAGKGGRRGESGWNGRGPSSAPLRTARPTAMPDHPPALAVRLSGTGARGRADRRRTDGARQEGGTELRGRKEGRSRGGGLPLY